MAGPGTSQVTSAQDRPLLSIVTVHLDDLEGLAATHASIHTDSVAEDLEWIVVDGGTRAGDDAGRAVMERARVAARVFISEPDKGIYDAMNKGLTQASGYWVLFLNAGDSLHPDFTVGPLRMLPEPAPDMVWGISWDQRAGEVAYPVHSRPPWWLRYGPALAHQAIFFRRSALGVSPYDTRLSIAADYDLICRLYRRGGGVERIDVPVCVFRLGGRSAADPRTTLREEARVRRTHFQLPGWFDAGIMHVKLAIWKLNQRFPQLRRTLRRRI